MLVKHRKLILFTILFIAFGLRFFAASNIVVNLDEGPNDFPAAQKISFRPGNLNLPLVDKKQDPSPMSLRYIIKLGWSLFGETRLGARIPFVLIGTLTIFLVYFFAKSAFDVETALLTALLMAISQYYIHLTRIADYNGPFILFVMASLFVFYETIKNNRQCLLILNGILIGAGFWVRESILLLIPIYIIFLLVMPQYRYWFKNKYFYISVVIIIFFGLPLYLLNLNHVGNRFAYISEYSNFRLSINAIGFYLGELILLAAKPFPHVFRALSGNLESESPIVSYFFGILILISAVVSMKNKDTAVRLLVVCFWFNFIIFSFISPSVDYRRQYYFSLENLDWSTLGLIPGIMLTSNFLVCSARKKRVQWVTILTALIILMSIRALDLITYPLQCFFPTRDVAIRKLLDDYGISWMTETGFNKNKKYAEEIYKIIFNLPNTNPLNKKKAALKLVSLLNHEGRKEEGKKYSEYLSLLNTKNNIRGERSR